MFFEAWGNDGENRYFHIDSKDGYIGLDFDAYQASDWDTAGSTELVLDIDIGESNGLAIVRQSKIGWRTLDSWTWDGAPGTFMMITGSDEAGQTKDGIFQANWDGSRWLVARDSSGDAIPVVLSAHGPVVAHLGEDRYKLYYEERINGGKMDKPFRMIYTNEAPTTAGAWESYQQAREVHFLWPDGTLLSDASESGVGDHVIICPAGDLDFQVMFNNLGGPDDSSNPKASLGVGITVLVNP